MANVNLGKVALTPKGNWDNTITYEKLDIVTYDGDSYIAKTEVPVGISVTTGTEYWQLFTEKGNGISVGDVIIASTTQPTVVENKLWIKEESDEEYDVLTIEDIDDTAGKGDYNVTWSADKITKDCLTYRGTIPNNADLNDYMDTGFYHIGLSTIVINSPSEASQSRKMLFVFRISSTYCRQYYYVFESNGDRLSHFYTRFKDSSGWNNWFNVIDLPIDDSANIGGSDKLWSAEKTYNEISTITNTIRNFSNNLIGMVYGALYPLDFSSINAITISTSDGSNFLNRTCLHCFDKDYHEIDLYRLDSPAASQYTLTITNSIKNTRYVFLSVAKNSPAIMVNEGSNTLPYEPYGKLKEEEIRRIYDFETSFDLHGKFEVEILSYGRWRYSTQDGYHQDQSKVRFGTNRLYPLKFGDKIHIELENLNSEKAFRYQIGSFNDDGTEAFMGEWSDPIYDEIEDTFNVTVPANYYIMVAVVSETEENVNNQDLNLNITLINGNIVDSDIITLNDPIITYEKLGQLRTTNYTSTPTYRPLVLLHFSDLHTNAKILQRVMDYYNYYSNYIDDIIHTGDCVGSNNKDFSFWGNTIGANRILNLIGNHDTWRGGNYNTYEDWRYLDEEQSYLKYFAPFISNWGSSLSIPENKCYYKKDYADSNLTLIALDCMHVNSDQLTWFVNALADAKIANRHVIIASHVRMRVNMNYFDNLTDPFENLSGSDGVFPTQIDSDFVDAIDDFVSNGGIIACCIFGHFHTNIVGTYNNILNVSVTTAGDLSAGRVHEERKAGTKSYDAFNLVSVDTNKRVVKVMPVGQSINAAMQKMPEFCWDYINHRMLSM